MLRNPRRLPVAASASRQLSGATRNNFRAVHSKAHREEVCAIVDEDNNVIRGEPRSVTVRDRLLGRGAYVAVCNSSNHILVSKRSIRKDVYPGLQDTVISGVCLYGESYEDTALREISEELGLPRGNFIPTQLRDKRVFRWTDDSCDVWACAFRLVLPDQVAADIKLQAEEIESAQLMPMQQVQWMLRNNPERFTPVGAKALSVLGLA